MINKISIITRADDAGANHAANAGILTGIEAGWVKNVSLMAGGPAIKEAAQMFAHRQDICFGLHFTINAEWEGIKWKPICSPEEIASLLDQDNQFYPNTTFHGRQVKLEEIKKEWYAQYAYLKSLGFSITYADTHMFPELAIPELQDAMSTWIKEKGLIDARYFYHPLLCMDEFAHHSKLSTRVIVNAPCGQYFCLHHPAIDHEDMELCYNTRNPKGRVREKRAKEALFLAGQELQSVLQMPNVSVCRYDEAILDACKKNSLQEWRSAAISYGYQIEVLDADTFQISDGLGNHCYLLIGRKRYALVDAGIGMPYLDTLIHSLTQFEGLLLYTHGHFDHLGDCRMILERYLHPLDQSIAALHASRAYRAKLLPHFLGKSKFPIAQVDKEKMLETVFPKFHPYEEQQSFDLGGRVLRIVHTPAHTQGSICVYDETRNRIFTGDTLVKKGILLSFPESGTIAQFESSLQLLYRISTPYTRFYGGHHETGFQKEWITKYLNLIRKIKSHAIHAIVEESSFGKTRRYYDEDICIALPYQEDTN